MKNEYFGVTNLYKMDRLIEERRLQEAGNGTDRNKEELIVTIREKVLKYHYIYLKVFDKY